MAFKIHWAGDSTVKINNHTTYPQTGIGQALSLFLEKDVTICNHAENGRSTKSFIDEFRLADIYSVLRQNDFLFIQFGHNDAKAEDDTRYTEPFGDYQDNLEKFVNVARNRGAYPVFITPVCRRWFDETGILKPHIHGEYPKAMIEVGNRLSVPVIDLYEKSRDLIAIWGEEVSRQYFMNLEAGEYPNYFDGLKDDTHLTYPGAVAFSELIAVGLGELGGVYKDLLLETDRH